MDVWIKIDKQERVKIRRAGFSHRMNRWMYKTQCWYVQAFRVVDEKGNDQVTWFDNKKDAIDYIQSNKLNFKGVI
jgi:hypothetical protein